MEIIKMMEENLKSIWDLIDYSENRIEIEITWGDWKHDHLRADWFMADHGWELVENYATEDDGSDCYSAIHVYNRLTF